MFSPFEEIELLADSLPDEGETLLVTRHDGQLVCKPVPKDSMREGIENSELYGFLVKSNERLHDQGLLPMWASSISYVWAAILVFAYFQLQWAHWYLLPALAFPLLCGTFVWIRVRQQNYFLRQIVPALVRELNAREIHPNSLIAGVRQHSELRTLLDELIRWNPRVNCH